MSVPSQPAVPPARTSAVRDATAAFASDVQYYLSLDPRQLPSRYFYDALGSALFEAICELPWYRSRARSRGCSPPTGARSSRAAPLSRIVELGPGSGEKLATPGRRPPLARRWTCT